VPDPYAAVVVLTEEERVQLEAWARRPRIAQSLAMRSRIVLASAEGGTNGEVADRLGLSRGTVSKWRGRFALFRLDGVLDEPRPGRPRTITDVMVERVITKTLESTPTGATHWSTRSMAAEVGLNQTAISRIWRAFGLQPHRQDSWKLSKDPQILPMMPGVPERASHDYKRNGTSSLSV
jgi:transposase